MNSHAEDGRHRRRRRRPSVASILNLAPAVIGQMEDIRLRERIPLPPQAGKTAGLPVAMVLHREKGAEEAWCPVTDQIATRWMDYVTLMAPLAEEELRRLVAREAAQLRPELVGG